MHCLQINFKYTRNKAQKNPDQFWRVQATDEEQRMKFKK